MRIKEILSEKGMSAKELAKACGLSEMGMSNILTSKSQPNANTLIKIASALGVKCGELFDDYESVTVDTPVCPHCGKPITVKLV